jgi:hypothetical protein
MGFGPVILRFAGFFLLVRVGLAALAGWGLLERTQWGRIVAIVAACLSLIKFPFGTALGIWTLVVLLGYRNSTLYDPVGTWKRSSRQRGRCGIELNTAVRGWKRRRKAELKLRTHPEFGRNVQDLAGHEDSSAA